VVKNGQSVKIANDKLFVSSLVKDGIMKGPQSKAVLLKFIHEHEASEAAAERRTKADPFGGIKEFSWTDEQEKLFQKLENLAEAIDGKPERPLLNLG
jgi:hypothetical protein